MRQYIVTYQTEHAPEPMSPTQAGSWRLIGPPVVVEYRQVEYHMGLTLRPYRYAFYWEREADE